MSTSSRKKQKLAQMQKEAKRRRLKWFFGISVFCFVLFVILAFINPSVPNMIGLVACAACALRLYVDLR